MDCDVDLVGAAGKLSHSTNSPRSICSIHLNIDRNPDTCSSHINGNASANRFADSHTFIDADSGTAWLSEATGGLHTCGGQRLDA